MKTQSNPARLSPLSVDQLAQYERDGYIILPQACSHDLVDVFNSYVRSLQTAKELADSDSGKKEQQFTPHVFNHHLHDGFYLQMMKLPIVRGALAQILGDEAVGVVSNYMFKDPGSPGTAPHQDYYYIHNEPNTLVAAWIALEDADVENGCLWALPGSHRLGLLSHGSLTKPEEYEAENKEVENVDLSKQIPLVMKKGDIVIFHNLLIHSSLKNRTADRLRKSYVCHYIWKDSSIERENLKKKISLA